MSRYWKRRGFTLFDIIIVIVILSILAVIVSSQFGVQTRDLRPVDTVQSIDQQMSALKAEIQELNDRIRFHDMESIKLTNQLDAAQEKLDALEKKKTGSGSPTTNPPATLPPP